MSQTRKESHKDAMGVKWGDVAKGEESSTMQWYVTWVHFQKGLNGFNR